MNYIVIGLGNFGAALAERLTSMGHDVIGVDSDMNLVEKHKNTITSTMCMSLTDAPSLKNLPLDEADKVIVTVGDNLGNSILIVSLLKQAKVQNLVARANNDMHRTILEALGVNEVIMPERFTADIWAVSADSTNIKSVYVITDKYKIIECEIPSILEGLSLVDANVESKFNLRIVAIKRQRSETNFFGTLNYFYEVIMPETNFVFKNKDRLILYGDNSAIDKFKKQLIQ